jgi:hypothetical protein
VVESQQVLEWMAQGEAKGEAKGTLQAWRDALCVLLESKFGPLPNPVVQQIQASQELQRLRDAVSQVLHHQNLFDLQL